MKTILIFSLICFTLSVWGPVDKIKNSNTDRDVKWGSAGGQQTPNNSVKFYPSGSTSTSANTGDAVFNTSVYVQNSVLFGAA